MQIGRANSAPPELFQFYRWLAGKELDSAMSNKNQPEGVFLASSLPTRLARIHIR
jgi:hypothetical protein